MSYLYGDPFIEWEEENAAREEFDDFEDFPVVPNKGCKVPFDVIALQDEVINLLTTFHDFTLEDAEESVNTSFNEKPHLWHENTDAKEMANFLASDENDA